MDKYKVCPICKQKYTQHPAISRIDNKTNICPACGIQEALLDFIRKYNKENHYKKNKATD